MCTEGLQPQDNQFISDICRQHGSRQSELISILHDVQQHFGFLPAEVQQEVAKNLGIPASKVFGVVTFYSLFTMKPRGRNPINICTGTACYVRGAQAVLEELERTLGIKTGETTPDGRFSLSCLRCVGACGLAPVLMVGEKIHARVKPEDLRAILETYA